jgi:hypothetical protein
MSIKSFWEKHFEPDHNEHPKLCQESRETFKECVVASKCFKDTEDFKKCARENINAECIPARIEYFRCKRYLIDRSKDFRKDPRHPGL